MMAQSTRWCFTLNNFTEDEFNHLQSLGDNMVGNGLVYLVFGRETGESGTPHLQGFVVFSTRKRLRFLRNFISARGHYEAARGDTSEAADYCKKDGDFIEFGELPVRGRVTQPSVADFVVWVGGRAVNEVNERTVANSFPNLYLRYGSRLLNLAGHIQPEPLLEDHELNDWQTVLLSDLESEADDRSIRFYVDPTGGKGKSFFCRWMLTKRPEITQVLSSGKRDDIAHAIDVTKNVFLFNLPRGGMEYFQYSIAEGLKDRIVFSPKYNSTMKILQKKAHVIVFSNEPPDETKLSEDRLDIIYL